MIENRNNSVISLILYLSQKSIVMYSFETLFFYLIDYQQCKREQVGYHDIFMTF